MVLKIKPAASPKVKSQREKMGRAALWADKDHQTSLNLAPRAEPLAAAGHFCWPPPAVKFDG
jgi:hypothetical protein